MSEQTGTYRGAIGVQEKPTTADLKRAFARVTSGMQDPEKLHLAVRQGYRHEMEALLKQNVKPADKTIKHILDRNAYDQMETLVEFGYKPKQALVDKVADAAWRTHDMHMLYELLEAPGVMPDERTFYHMIDTGRGRLVERFLSEGIKATPAMVDRAVHNYIGCSPEYRDSHRGIMRALTAAGAIPARETIKYARNADYLNLLADELSAAREINKQQAPKKARSKKFRFGKKNQPAQGI